MLIKRKVKFHWYKIAIWLVAWFLIAFVLNLLNTPLWLVFTLALAYGWYARRLFNLCEWEATLTATIVYTIFRLEDGPYMVRKFVVTAGEVAELEFVMIGTLENTREQLRELGLTCVPRSAHDNPNIVESWF